MMKILLPIILFSIVLNAAQNEGKKLYLKKINSEIKIDGVIDPIWNTADSATNFFQLQPYYAKKPTWPTVAKVLTTDDALYCIMICYEDKKDIQINTGTLDNGGGDIVSIMLDTFNDKKTAYKFAVTASGVRADCRLLDDARNRDYSWDGIWFAASKVYDWGFVVEMKIPYKSIQYNKNLKFFGLDFDRWIPAKNEDLYWCKYEQNEGMRVSKYGELVFENFKPSVKGLNLEIYPVGISKANYLPNGINNSLFSSDAKYKIEPNIGLDVMYNPSPALKFQLTANPDFAQIEADPYQFNISQYETYFDEKRPFFTEGNEIFMAAGKQSNTGFYSPLQLFYSRRIGKKLPDGSDVPLVLGTKAFGRFSDWEYGGFLAMTGSKNYLDDGIYKNEPSAVFGSARIKKQIFENSSVGMLFVGKQTKDSTYGVIDIDGAIRTSEWQLAYQVARSIQNTLGDYAASAGFTQFGKDWVTFARMRYVGNNFNIEQVGYVPWIGTGELTAITGPNWYIEKGPIRSILIFGGFSLTHKNIENYTDHSGVFVYNMQFRNNWGGEIDVQVGKSKDQGIKYNSYEIDYSTWFNINPNWDANFYGGYSKTYNFNRDYLAFYTWHGINFDWNALDILRLGTSYNMWIEGNPSGGVEDIVFDMRPYFSFTPVNNLNLRVYIDNLYDKSSQHMEQIIGGFLFSYNFLPKSWIYFAYNEVDDRSDQYDINGNLLPQRMHVSARAGVFKIKYLYYF